VPPPKQATSASRGLISADPTTTGHWKDTSADCSRGDGYMGGLMPTTPVLFVYWVS
jgi:hypothetical protein